MVRSAGSVRTKTHARPAASLNKIRRPGTPVKERCHVYQKDRLSPAARRHDAVRRLREPNELLYLRLVADRSEVSAAKSPAEALEDLRNEWRQAKADPTTTAADLREIASLGKAVALVDQVMHGSR